MTGRTSADVTVTGELRESYEATLREPLGGFGIDAELADNLVAVCAARANAWATMHGVEIELYRIERVHTVDQEDRNAAGEVCCITPHDEYVDIGVSWSIVVGKGSSTNPLSTYPEITTGIGWIWSPRWMHWLGWFKSMIAATEARQYAERVNAGAVTIQQMQQFIDGKPTQQMADGIGRPDPGQPIDVSDEHPDLYDLPEIEVTRGSAIFEQQTGTPAELPADAELDVDTRETLPLDGLEGQWRDHDGDVWKYDADEFDVWVMMPHDVDPSEQYWQTTTPRREYGPFTRLSEDDEL